MSKRTYRTKLRRAARAFGWSKSLRRAVLRNARKRRKWW